MVEAIEKLIMQMQLLLSLTIEKVYGTNDMTFHSTLGDDTKYDKPTTEAFENPGRRKLQNYRCPIPKQHW